MSSEITTAFVRDFKEGITLLAQQKMSRFRPAVRVEMVKGDRAHFDQVGSVTAQPVTTRHADTPLTDTPHSRRMVTTTPYKHADLIDDNDKVRILNDPTSTYVRAFAAAFGRRMDQVVIDAAFAVAATGVDGSGTGTFPTATHEAPTTAGGMTVAKMMEAKEILDAFENDSGEGYFMAMGARQIRDLLTDSTGSTYAAASSDYVEAKGLLTGEISRFAGFNIIRSEQLALSGADRSCIAWAKNSLLLGIGAEPQARLSERPDKNYSMQAFYAMDIGATRMDELGVVRVICDET